MKNTERHGTQTLERAVLVLKELTSRGTIGWRLSDLASSCQLDRGTTHRIVACFIRERLARQRKSDRRYVPGPLVFELGLSLPQLSAFQLRCAAPVARVAKHLNGESLLYFRSGAEFICVARAGVTQLKALTIEVGTRRPLIVSAGGLAMLVALSKDEARAIVDDNLKRVRRFGETRIRSLKRVIRQSQKCGYGVSKGDIVPGVSAFGVPIRDSNGDPFASISVVGVTESFPGSRIPEVIETLEREARVIELEAYGLIDRGK